MPLERETRRKLQKLRDKFLPGPVVLKPFEVEFLGVVLRPIFGGEIPKSLEEQTAILKEVWEKVDASRNADTRQSE
jgi:hypothetical protein